jgi:hypothetical protein
MISCSEGTSDSEVGVAFSSLKEVEPSLTFVIGRKISPLDRKEQHGQEGVERDEFITIANRSVAKCLSMASGRDEAVAAENNDRDKRRHHKRNFNIDFRSTETIP